MILSSERPQEWQAVYDSVKRGGYSGLDGRAEMIYADNKVFDACQSFAQDEQRAACQAQATRLSHWMPMIKPRVGCVSLIRSWGRSIKPFHF
ncbi:type IV secretion system protein [Pseudomonas alliivorans]|nr:type IV secretion system protein [Pseudomonas alliivorans]